MCKQHTIYFGCGHKLQQRASTCNFKRVIRQPDGKSVSRACHSFSYLVRNFSGSCKTCYFEEQKTEIERLTENLCYGTFDDAPQLAGVDIKELEDVSAWKDKQLEDLAKTLPRCDFTPPNRHTSHSTWNSRRSTGRTTSLLSIEVLPEDVVGHFDWETNLVSDDSITINTPITDIWDDTADDGWGEPGDNDLTYESSESSKSDLEEQDDLEPSSDADITQATEVDDVVICYDDVSKDDTIDWPLSGSTWGFISIA